MCLLIYSYCWKGKWLSKSKAGGNRCYCECEGNFLLNILFTSWFQIWVVLYFLVTGNSSFYVMLSWKLVYFTILFAGWARKAEFISSWQRQSFHICRLQSNCWANFWGLWNSCFIEIYFLDNYIMCWQFLLILKTGQRGWGIIDRALFSSSEVFVGW